MAATLAGKSDTQTEPLGIVAGGGAFPLLVAEAAMARGRAVFIFGIVDEASPEIARFPHRWIKRGQLGALFSGLRERRIRDLVLIGGIRDRRMPRFSEIDIGGVWAVLRHIHLLSRGDDGVLRRIARFFEANGLRIVGAAEVAPELTIAAGVATVRAPTEAECADIRAGLVAAREHGARDLGQAVIVENGQIVLTETRAGTDAMLATYRNSGRGGGVLVKCLKPNQDRRMDMPAIGPETAAGVVAAGLRGMAVSARTTLVVDVSEVVRQLDAADAFLVGISDNEGVA